MREAILAMGKYICCVGNMTGIIRGEIIRLLATGLLLLEVISKT